MFVIERERESVEERCEEEEEEQEEDGVESREGEGR